MQIRSARKARPHRSLHGGAGDLGARLDLASGAIAGGRQPLSMYARPPLGEITLDEFESFAFDRLQVLRAIETGYANGKSPADLEHDLNRLLAQFSLDDARKDNISHFILRLAYSRRETQRKAFLQFEETLFRHRFRISPGPIQNEFFKQNKMDFEQAEAEEIHRLIDEEKIHIAPGEDRSRPGRFFKVPFQKVLKLVMRRAVYLHRGVAYIPESQIIEVVVTKFRAHLSRELAIAYRATQNQRRDRRLEPLLASLATHYLGPKIKSKVGGTVTPADIPVLAKQSFPLCMRNTYEHLKHDHHLKHGGRMHFSLFLKAIGLSLEDALRFWRSNFEPRTPGPKFDKQYAYMFKHNYGKVGSGTSYSPYSCLKIINHIPTGGDHCGCPYKLFPDEGLRAKLRQMGMNESAVKEISAKAKNGDFQPACALAFYHSHPGIDKDDVSIMHPNGYFEQSIAYYKEKEEGKSGSGDGSSQSSQGSGAIPGLAMGHPAGQPSNFVVGAHTTPGIGIDGTPLNAPPAAAGTSHHQGQTSSNGAGFRGSGQTQFGGARSHPNNLGARRVFSSHPNQGTNVGRTPTKQQNSGVAQPAKT